MGLIFPKALPVNTELDIFSKFFSFDCKKVDLTKEKKSLMKIFIKGGQKLAKMPWRTIESVLCGTHLDNLPKIHDYEIF